jgi:hypothetical protein
MHKTRKKRTAKRVRVSTPSNSKKATKRGRAGKHSAANPFPLGNKLQSTEAAKAANKKARNAVVRVWDAIEKEGKTKGGKDLFKHLVKEMKSDNKLLGQVLTKLMPTRVEEHVTPEDVQRVFDVVVDVLSKHVKQQSVIEKVAAELAKIDIPSTGRTIRVAT